MTNEFKIKKFKDATVYTLESASGGSTSAGSIASMDRPLGKEQIVVQSRMGTTKTPPPRNFVAKNAKMGGAGAHKDKKKEQKQGNVKHKNKDMDMAEGEKTMSRAAKGHEKYGKAGMQALAKAGRDGASEKKLDTIRNRYDTYNEDSDPCWKDYKQIGMKKKGSRSVPNCVPKEGVGEDHEVSMASNELKSIHSDAQKLLGLVQQYGENGDLQAWQQSKITKAADYLNSVLQSIGGEQGVAEGLGKDIKRLATGKDVKSRAGQEIAKSQDAGMKGDTKTSKKHFDRYDKLDKLANKEQGVAEGSDKFSVSVKKDKSTYPELIIAVITNNHTGEQKVIAGDPRKLRQHLKHEFGIDYNFGEQGVAEGLSKRDQQDVAAIRAAIARLESQLNHPNADKAAIQQSIAHEKKRLALYGVTEAAYNPDTFVGKKGTYKGYGITQEGPSQWGISSSARKFPTLDAAKRHIDKNLVAEGGIGDKIKGAAKSVKRASQGWGAGGESDAVSPKDVVQAFGKMDGQRLANFVASRKDLSKPRNNSARAFADKVIDREMRQRGYGRVAGKDEQGVAEGASDYVGDAIEALRSSKPGLGQEDFLDELYMYIENQYGQQAAEMMSAAGQDDFDEWYHSYTDMAEGVGSSIANNPAVQQAIHHVLVHAGTRAIDAVADRLSKKRSPKNDDADDEYSKNLEEMLELKLAEKIPKGADVDYYIKDFAKSNAPQFRGKTPEKKKQMAVAAYYGSKQPKKKKR